MPGKQYEIAENMLTLLLKTSTAQVVCQNLIRPIFSFPNPKYLRITAPTVELSKLHLLIIIYPTNL